MKAVIMAGGLGSRLQPLTDGCPKPLVSFVNKPVLDHILNLLKRHHFSEVVITVKYLADQIQNYLGDGRHLGLTIHYALEKIPLGTAGSVKNAQQYLGNETFLVISGDAITDIDLAHLLRFHKDKQALATLALKRVFNPQEFGVVVTDANGCVTQYIEKPKGEQVISNIVNTGIYVLEPEVLALMEPNRAYDFSLDIFPLLLRQNLLFGCLVDGYWCDMGTIQSYLKAVTDALAGKVNHISAGPVGEQQSVNGGYYFQRKRKEQLMAAQSPLLKFYPLFWVILSLGVLSSDYAMRPFIQFPFLFIIPVTLAAWHSGKWWGFGLAVSLPIVRLYFSTLWDVPWTMQETIINALIRMAVLLLLAFLVDWTAVQSRALAKEVQVLSGLLPICSHCKKICNEDNTWEQLEQYITRHSEAQFSHGLCPECSKQTLAKVLQIGVNKAREQRK